MALKFDPQNPNYEFIQDQQHLEELINGDLKDQKLIAVDVEGTALDPYQNKLLLLQLSTEETAFIFDAQKLNLAPLKEILSSPRPLKLLQNAKFDYEHIKVHLNIELGNIFDTLLAERLLTAGRRREGSLEFLAKKYLDVELNKDIRLTFGKTSEITPSQLKYAALDVLVLHPIFKKQYAELKKNKLVKVAQLEFGVAPVVAEMELRGVLIDTKKWRKNMAKMEKTRDEVAEKIQQELRPLYKNNQVDLFGKKTDVINLNSPVQIMAAFEKLGIDLPSTSEAVLKITDHPLSKLLLEYRGCEKLITAFGENLLQKINPITGRLHPDFIQLGAHTGRFACSNPNLQQIPTDSAFRSCFIPAPGYKFVVADYSQIELRVMAELSQDPEFVRAYKEDKDLHTLTASQMYQVPMDKVGKKMRRAAKDINFGLMYGRGATSLASQLGVSVDEARKLLDAYFRTYKKVKHWIDQIGKSAIRDGYSETLAGRKRWYNIPEPSDPNYERLLANIERQGKNTPIQGTSADMTKYALVYIDRGIKENNLEAYPILTIHDEIVIEVTQDQAEKMREIMIEEMVKAGQVLLKTVPIKVDAVITDVWEH